MNLVRRSMQIMFTYRYIPCDEYMLLTGHRAHMGRILLTVQALNHSAPDAFVVTLGY